MRISVLESNNVRVAVSANVQGAVYNPTGDAVQFAFVADGVTPGSGDWVQGTWETDPGPTYVALCLVGPAGTVLTAGTYQVWVKVTDNPEVPVQSVDQLIVF